MTGVWWNLYTNDKFVAFQWTFAIGFIVVFLLLALCKKLTGWPRKWF